MGKRKAAPSVWTRVNSLLGGCHPKLDTSLVGRNWVPTGQEGARLTPGAL